MWTIGRVSWLIVCLCGLFIGLASPTACQAQTAAEEVKARLDVLHGWLSTNAVEGPKWRQYLKSDDLTRQLARGGQADRATVQRILKRYSGDAPGLERWQFVAVRQALAAWINELPLSRVDQLPQLARDAQRTFVPLTAAHVQRAKQELMKAVAELEKSLAEEDEGDAADWKEFLAWPELRKQLDAKPGPDLKVLHELAPRFYANETGLERPAYVNTRQALVHYVNTALFAATPNAREEFQKQLQELAPHLESFAKQPTTDEAMAIGRTLGWLEQFGQSADLVSAVRGHYLRPNLFAQLSPQVIASGVSSDVEEDSPIQECILGTMMYGTAHMVGHVTAGTAPFDEKAAVDIILTGTTYSSNVGYNGPVTVYSRGVTAVNAQKRLLIDHTGIEAEPARAWCSTNSTIDSIKARRAIIEKIAWRRARKSKSQAEAIASQRAAARVQARVDEQSVELLEKANAAFQERFRAPLVRRDAFPRSLAFRTDATGLFVTTVEAGPGDLAAPNDPPALTPQLDAAVRIHESLPGNLCQPFLGGITLTDERLAMVIEGLTGSVPEELQIRDENDPWSITFAAVRPIDIRFANSGFTVVIRGARFTRGDQALPRSMHISAAYKVERTAKGTKFTRQGDVQVELPGVKQLSVSQVAMKTFAKKRFELLFKAEIESQGVGLPGRWTKAGKLHLAQLHCDKGWLALGWRLQPEDRVAMKD